MTAISIHIIANQSSYHDDKSTLQCFIRVFCPQLIRNVQSRRRIDSYSIIAHPVNSDLHTWVRSLKCYAKNSTYIYILFTVSFHEKFEKKMFFKIFKSWQVCDWLAKWIIMLQFMDLRWPRVYLRANVGLVIFYAPAPILRTALFFHVPQSWFIAKMASVLCLWTTTTILLKISYSCDTLCSYVTC